ncbi:hypothetical protein [Pyxidicoccus xibeiensis]|uniref:hypothetical protein n=1 Tax=Pyxidicoccus xibeiensis TaxID=2906759 RepID=UPI0020A75CD0|nr:hypothetical protein [Pyxidicoccus xibeiensis]MCP3141828.1 hypothetical protein [Pyxidicoccus xibeiensis]
MTTPRRRTRNTLLLSLLTLSTACGDNTPEPKPPPPAGKPLATLQGRLALDSKSQVNEPVRLALAWYPSLLTEQSGPVSKPVSIVTEDVAYTGGFPVSYTFDVTAAPPAEALVELGDGMRGKGSVGIVLAYNDRNGNGKLDTIRAEGTPVDRVLGASLEWTRPPAFMVMYLDSAQAPATGLQQGFNLVRLDDNLTSNVVPLTTSIPVVLRNDPLLDAFVCEAAWDDTTEQAPCGLGGDEPAEGALLLTGELSFNGTQADLSFDVRRDGVAAGDAQVRVFDQVASYDEERKRYTLHIDDASGLLDGGLVAVTARQGNDEVTRTVMVPARFEVTWPTVPMSYSPGEAVQAAWTESKGARRYEVSVRADGQVLASEGTADRRTKLTPRLHGGAATLRVVAVEVDNSLVVRRSQEVPISFTPCDTVTSGSHLTVEGSFEHYDADFMWQSSDLRVEVKDNDEHVTDARVMLAGMDVPYMLQEGAFHNVFISMSGHGFGESVEMRVMRGGNVLCRTLTLPGEFDLTLEGELSRPTGSSFSASWTRAARATRYDLWLSESADAFPLYSGSTNDLEFTFDKIDYVGTLNVRFAAVAHPTRNDTLGVMDVKRMRTGSATFTE